MKRRRKGLIFKLGMVLLLLLGIKLIMISVGIYSALNLEDDAKSINFAGSERMRSLKLSFLINEWIEESSGRRHEVKASIIEEIDRFDEVLEYLLEGEETSGGNRYEEPEFILKMIDLHPSFQYIFSLPGVYEPELKLQIERVTKEWRGEMKPLILEIIAIDEIPLAREKFMLLNDRLPHFVDEVDHFVALLEDSFNRKVNLFTAMQYLFILITVGVSLTALDQLFLHMRSSVTSLIGGIQAMTAGDFSKRVNVTSNDEMGDAAEGFNFMAEKLEEFYHNLESKVEEKTRILGKRNNELSILYDMVASLKKSLPLSDILHVFLEKILGHLNVAGGIIRLYEEDGSLTMAADVGLEESFKLNVLSSECNCVTSAPTNQLDPWGVVERSADLSLDKCANCQFKSATEIPISFKVKDLGVITLFHEGDRKFTSTEKRLIESLNNHLGAAIEYYNLNAKTRHLAIIEERNMLASELHDSIAQSLSYLKIQGGLLEDSLIANNMDQAYDDLAQIRVGIEESIQVIRELLVHFRTKIESEGLEATFKKFIAKFQKETGIEAILNFKCELPLFSPGDEVHVFHIVQEAFANARKYANATKIEISIFVSDKFEVIIKDNGQGFDLEEVKNKGSSHVGMDIMQERASRLGGKLNIESSAGAGTSVRLTI